MYLKAFSCWYFEYDMQEMQENHYGNQALKFLILDQYQNRYT